MKGVTIRDHNAQSGILSFDLRDILLVLGDDAERSNWTVREVECVGGESAAALHQASDRGEPLTWNNLLRLAQRVEQVIDGSFHGRLANESEDWIIIRAVDSSAFDVETDRVEVLVALRAHFNQVDDLLIG